MEMMVQSSLCFAELVLQLNEHEIETLKSAQTIVQSIREHVGRDDCDNAMNMAAKQIEHGIAELLENKMILIHRTLEPDDFIFSITAR